VSGVQVPKILEYDPNILNRGVILPEFVECDNRWDLEEDGDKALKLFNGLLFFEEDAFKAWINKGYITCSDNVESEEHIQMPYPDNNDVEVLKDYAGKSAEQLIINNIWEEITT
jgi:hypothetical protein